MKKIALAFTLGVAMLGSVFFTPGHVVASDHDDPGSTEETKNQNLTELYVFTERSQNPSVNSDDLIFIMCLNDRSVAGTQYHFNTDTRYEFHVSRVKSNDDVPTGVADGVLRFEFDAPGADNKQNITVTSIMDGKTMTGRGMTTPIKDAPNNNSVKLGDSELTVFAGTREDPFFFDVDQFFKVRAAAAAGNAGSVLFKDTGVDFTAGFNVLSIAVRVPRKFLAGSSDVTSFDVWETISVKK